MPKRPTVLDHLQQLDVPKPSDLIIEQVRELIASGVLAAGQRLPPERELAQRFGVGRGHVREALRKLEFYGIVRTLPQSGTFVEDMGARALDTMISNVLSLETADITSMLEVRQMLEEQAARKAAERASPAQIAAIRAAHEEHRAAVADGLSGIELDLKFHLLVASATNNSMLRSLVSLLAPEIVNLCKRHRTCEDDRPAQALEEHKAVLRAIERRDSEAAGHAMRRHLVMTISQVPGALRPA